MKRVCIAILLSLVGACGSDTPDELSISEAQGVCKSFAVSDQTVSAFTDASGARVEGSIYTSAVIEAQPLSYVALAQPEKKIVRKDVIAPGFCCLPIPPYGQLWCTYYRNCPQTLEFDLSGIYGLARAPDLHQALSMALDNCKVAAERYAEDTEGISKYSGALKCVVTKQSQC